MEKKLKVKRKLVYKLTHRYECEIVKFYTLIPVTEKLSRGRSMHLMPKNSC